jgi:hypothetical protein
MFGKINTKSLEIKNEPNVMSVKSEEAWESLKLMYFCKLQKDDYKYD